MESVMDKHEAFVLVRYGSGSGSGCGSGYGDGRGYGSGDGSGYGSGITLFNGEKVYIIDGLPTILRNIHGNYARGAILHNGMTLSPCYIAKSNDFFAHGETLQEAIAALQEKLFEDMPEDERIDAFLAEFAEKKPYPVSAFFDWHHRLTGSCDMGRREFAKAHGIDIENGEMTVAEFVRLTRDSYGSEIIRNLEGRLKNE